MTLCLLSPTAEVPSVYLDCLDDLTRYAETQWHAVNDPPGAGYFGDGVSGGNAGIRGNCGMALAYATLARAGRGDRQHLTDRAEAALRYAAETHVTGDSRCVDGKQWGEGWQTALWTGTLGLTALLLEDEIDPDVVAACQRVLAHEADRLAEIPPASGYRGDSKAEENAWNSNAPALAAAWMSDDPRADVWMNTARRYLANTYTVPDEQGPLAPWVTTTTLYPSYACENHGFFHPSYEMVSGMSLGDSWLMARLAEPGVARRLRPFATHNVMEVWDHLQAVQLDSGELAYPSGLDWSLHGFGQVAYLAWLSNHFGDPLAAWSETRLAHWIRQRQKLNGDGRFTGGSVANGFYREAVMARRVSIAWWHHQAARRAAHASPPADRLSHFEDVGVIAYRGPEMFASVSYGERYMALVAPSAGEAETAREAFVCTPWYPGILGGGLGPATSSRVLKYRDGAEAVFDVLIEAEHGPLSRSRARVAAYPDALAVIEAPYGLDLGYANHLAFRIGIENHAFTGGSRLLKWDGGSADAEAMSGGALTPPGSWISVDDRLAFIAGPGGTLRYDIPSSHNRRGAAEDTLGLEVAAHRPRFCILIPGASADVAARAADSVEWSLGADAAELSFVAPKSGRHTVLLELPAPDAPVRVAPIASIEASSSSEVHGPRLAIDGDTSTFWVSRRGSAEPGHGPTTEHPEWLEVELERRAHVAGIIVVPRPQYGPRQIIVELAGGTVYEGPMTSETLRVDLPEPVAASRLRLTMTDAFDPRHPDAPRNVQVAEVLVIEAGP
jgi:hypothetical protein